MKCLHIINSLGGGGAEKLLVDLLPAIKKLGTNVDLLVFSNQEERSVYSKALKTAGVDVIQLSTKSVYNPFVIFKLRSIIKNYDIVHVHLFPAQLWVAMASWGLKTKLITTEHAANNRRTAFYWNYIDRFFYSFYSIIVNVSSDVMKNRIISLGKKIKNKSVVIENGINLDFYPKVEPVKRNTTNLNIDDNDVLLIMAARFSDEKDQLTLIKSVALLPEKYKLLLLGVGIKQHECISFVNSLNISHRVFFLGFQSNVAGLIKMCDIFVLSSFSEGMPISIIEAMACSRPVVASNVDGIKRFIIDSGILFECGNEKDLALKIRELEDVAYYNFVAQKCKDASLKYDIMITAKKHIALYVRNEYEQIIYC